MITTAKIRPLLQVHIEKIACEFTHVNFDALREHYYRCEPNEMDCALKYRHKVEDMAREIRIKAFDNMVDELAEGQILDEFSARMMMNRITSSGIKVIGGDIHVVEGPLSLQPIVFHEDAFELFL